MGWAREAFGWYIDARDCAERTAAELAMQLGREDMLASIVRHGAVRALLDLSEAWTPGASPTSADVPAECAICHEPFSRLQACARTPCRHLFHEECIAQWLLTSARSNETATCPLCRCVPHEGCWQLHTTLLVHA